MIAAALALLMSVAAVLPDFTPEERRIFRLFRATRGQSVSDWAEANIVLGPKESNRPGELDLDLTPYLRGILNAFNRRGIDIIVVGKPAQVGGNVAGMAMLGWAICNAPAHAMFVKPVEEDSDSNIDKRVLPFLKSVAAIAEYWTGKVSNKCIELTHMDVRGGWASAPRSIKSWPAGYGFLDEADDCEEAGSGDPVQLLYDRTTTFEGRRKLVIWGTPKFPLGVIARERDACAVQCDWWVPCPTCGTYQILDFFTGIQYPPEARPEEVLHPGVVWYKCRANGCRIDWGHLYGMNLCGRWVSQYQTVHADGTVAGDDPPTDRIYFQLDSLFSPFVGWAKDVAQYLRAVRSNDPGKLQVWYNQRRGRPFSQTTGQAKADDLKRRSASAGPTGIVPPWTVRLLAAADTQKRHFWWGVRAFGPLGRSQLIAHGKADTFDELLNCTLARRYPTEGKNPVRVPVWHLAIDSGGGLTDANTSRTEEVYAWCKADPERRIAYKGSRNKSGAEQWKGTVGVGEGLYRTVMLRYMRPDFYKDKLDRLIRGDDGAPPWELHQGCNEQYRRQMTAEHRVIVPGSAPPVETWQKISEHADNHLWDVEVLLLALADWKGADFYEESETVAHASEAAAEPHNDSAHALAEFMLS